MTRLGWCKACASPLVKAINKKLAAGESYTAVAEWCKSKDFPITRQKLADHREHITDPRQTFVENARRNPTIKNNVSNDEFLQAVIDTATAKIEADPDAIGVAHGLKAVQIRESRGQKQGNFLFIIAQTMTGALPTTNPAPELIEGEWSEDVRQDLSTERPLLAGSR